MIMTTEVLIMGMSIYAMSSTNPVKLSMVLMSLSSSMFLCVSFTTSMVWMPLIFFLLFMGGILMMFMILSSVLPNEKLKKMKLEKTSLILGMALISAGLSSTVEESTSMLKGALSQPTNLGFLILILTLYFLGTISMLYKEEMPMRVSVCYENPQFCKLEKKE